MKLTKKTIDELPIPSPKNGKATQTIHRDDTLKGYGLLAGSGGTKSFFIERRINGRVKRMNIGRYGTLTPTQARIKAQELLSEIVLGGDPAKRKKNANQKPVTLGNAFNDYLETRKNLKASTIKTYKNDLNRYLTDWYPKRLTDISKDMVEARHASIGQTAPAKANATMRVLRAIFNHAIAKYEDNEGKPLLTINPVDRLNHNRAWYRIDRRITLLTPTELAPWYAATMELSNEVSRDYLHFLLFTGLRKTEAATLTWDQINFREKTVTIEETKNGKPHTLPLTTFLLDLLKLRTEYTEDSQWVFPSPIDGGHLREPRGSLQHIEKRMNRKVALHDLRRTFITIAESLDIPSYALKQLLNHHNPNDVTAGYIVSDVERLREPMQKISDFICGKIASE